MPRHALSETGGQELTRTSSSDAEYGCDREHPDQDLEHKLRALRDDPIVTLTRASKLRSTLEIACHAAGFRPRIAAETSDLSVVTEFVAEQMGVAVLPLSGLDGAPDLVKLGLTQPRLEDRILLVSRRTDGRPAARAFLAIARRHLSTTGPGQNRPTKEAGAATNARR